MHELKPGVRAEPSLFGGALATFGLRVPREVREQLILYTVLLLFAGVFVARLAVNGVDEQIALLYALPIALVAVEYGAKAGLLAGGVALALFALYTGIQDIDADPVAWTTRATLFLLLGGLLGRLSDNLRSVHAAVAAREDQLQSILNNSTSVVYVKDRDGHYLMINRQYERIFKVRHEDVVGKTDYDLFPKYAADAFRAADRKVIKADEALELEEVVPQKDGPHTYISTKFPLHDVDGRSYAVCGMSTDITARIHAERQTRESREQLRKIIDTAQEAFVSIDSNSTVTQWNGQAEATFGWSQEQAIGRSITKLIIPERYHDNHLKGIQHFLRTGEGPVLNKRMELTAVHRDGHEFPIEIAVSTVRTKGGYSFNAFLHDVSERKRIEELARVKVGLERQTAELKRSNFELAQFAHVASHDLSEPLRTVARYVQLLDNRYRGRLDQDADEFIGYAVEGASRMQALVNALNAYSTLGSAEHAPVPVDLNEIVRQAVGSLQAAIEDAGATVNVGEMPTVKADGAQLAEVFQNLISNSLKFVESEAPEVTVTAERRSDAWCFCVADNGIGIKPEHRNRIFEMFRRLHRKDQFTGTGIGLTICRKIVSRHGGRIWVEPGKSGGSVFRFTIPDTTDGPAPDDGADDQARFQSRNAPSSASAA